MTNQKMNTYCTSLGMEMAASFWRMLGTGNGAW